MTTSNKLPAFSLRLAAKLGLLASWPLVSWSLPDGPPPAHTGGFGEPTCEACHVGGADPGTPVAQAELMLPGTFAPGRSYDIAVVVRRDRLARAGFELAVRFASHEPLAAREAGRLALVETARTGLVRDSVWHVTYAGHTRQGTRGAAGEVRWLLRWTAPAEAQAVVFHAALLAANDDDSNLGDEVIVRAQVVRPASVTSVPRRR